MDGPTDWQGMLPNYWVSKDPRVPSITLTHVITNVFDIVSAGAGSADVVPGHKDDPDWASAEPVSWADNDETKRRPEYLAPTRSGSNIGRG